MNHCLLSKIVLFLYVYLGYILLDIYCWETTGSQRLLGVLQLIVGTLTPQPPASFVANWKSLG